MPTLHTHVIPTTLVETVALSIRQRIAQHELRPGMRLPSIRQMAEQQRVSKFTVVDAYDRLSAQGLIESRRGSGFYVKALNQGDRLANGAVQPHVQFTPKFDVVWLMKNTFADLPAHQMPGAGLLSPDWLDEPLIGHAMREVAKSASRAFFGYGSPQGYLPLRQQIVTRLNGFDIQVNEQQILTTNGVTQGIDIIARVLLKAGDTVLVDDPTWYVMFARFAMQGIHVVGVPREKDGPNLTQLADSLALYQPKLFLTHSLVHNPTGSSLSPAKAFQVLQLCRQANCTIVEDDIYGDFHSGQGAIRLAALDQLHQVIYLGGFSKTIGANLRVGFIAAHPDLINQLMDHKMLMGLTQSELGERVIYKILSQGLYHKHAERLRLKLDAERDRLAHTIDTISCRLDWMPTSGMFLWVSVGQDTHQLALRLMERGFLLAPGTIFRVDQGESHYLRLNVSTTLQGDFLRVFQEVLTQT
jgi:DNA-binding transcriptional MocR family regulator